MNNTTATRVIFRITRLRAGNVHVMFTDESSATTRKGAQVNYKIENSEYQHTPLLVTFSPDGEIVDVTKVEKA
jgi:hypothetical protein